MVSKHFQTENAQSKEETFRGAMSCLKYPLIKEKAYKSHGRKGKSLHLKTSFISYFLSDKILIKELSKIMTKERIKTVIFATKWD